MSTLCISWTELLKEYGRVARVQCCAQCASMDQGSICGLCTLVHQVPRATWGVSHNSLCFIILQTVLVLSFKQNVWQLSVKQGRQHLIQRLVIFSGVQRFVLRSFRNNSWPFHDYLHPFLPCHHTERLVASVHANFTYFTLSKDKIRKGIW